MKTAQSTYSKDKGWSKEIGDAIRDSAQLVLLFGHKELLRKKEHIEYIRNQYPKAEIIGCSTAGEIYLHEFFSDTLVATAIWFEKTEIKVVSKDINEQNDSYIVGQMLVDELINPQLRHVFVLSEGLNINGSELSKGLNSKINNTISITGGLAADQADFKETLVLHNGPGFSNKIVAVGFYGEDIHIGYGSKGGWGTFGVDREVTKSRANVLYELDNQPALDLYKRYLGPHAEKLPSSALLFPISLRLKDLETPLVRTVLSVNEEDGSMTFAGDIPQGEIIRLMNTNYEKLIEGAHGAAEMSVESLHDMQPDLAILISCVGRNLVLKHRTDEEIENVCEVLGEGARIAGFYSYGELCPSKSTDLKCELHNQTMTITTFKEL